MIFYVPNFRDLKMCCSCPEIC